MTSYFFLTTKEVSTILKIPQYHLYILLKYLGFGQHRLGAEYRFSAKEVLKLQRLLKQSNFEEMIK
jgi:hypothetical protein